MATTILTKTKSTYGNPYAYYKVEVTGTSDRTATSVKVALKITSNLSSSKASLGTGYTLKAYLYAGSGWSSAITLKASDAKWSGTTEHTKTATVTVTGLSSTATKLTGVKFKVDSSSSDDCCQLNSTSCSNISISSYHTSPEINEWTLKESNPALLNIGIVSHTFVKGLSQVKVEIPNGDATYYDNADFQKMALYKDNLDGTYLKIKDFTTNPAYFTPTTANEDYIVSLKLYDNQGGESNLFNTGTWGYATIDYTNLTLTSTVKRVGQTSGQVSISCNGNYFNGEIGNVNQKPSNNYKPTIKYKFWKVGTTEPSTYDNLIPDTSVTISNGTFSVSSLNIGSTTETAPNYFNPQYAYRVKIKVNDTFEEINSGDISIPTGEAIWTEYKDRVDFKKITIQGVEVTPSGGGGGDYTNLINKPQINSITLSGDKSASDLGFAGVATSGNYNDLSNKPTIPTVNNGTLTIQKNGTNVQTFSANQSGNTTANITVPTKTSDLTNDDNVVKDASYVHTDNNYTSTEKTKLSGIASGAEVNVQSDWNQSDNTKDDYIKNKPTIPTVNNATLTIQKNGTTVNTFTANASSNVTANITVPTKTSDITNDSGFITNSSLSSYVAKTGDTMSGKLTVPQIETGTGADNYFQTRKFRGEGNAGQYYHAIDFGYSGHNQVDLYEYGGVWNFWKNTTSTATTDTANQCLGITQTALKNQGYTYTFPNKTGTFAMASDIPTNTNQLTNGAGFITSSGSITGNAATATKATGDKNGNDITTTYQPTLVSGTNIKTINGYSILGSGNLPISGGGGTATNVQINGTSITDNGVANIITNGAYNSSSNKIATMSDLPTVNNGTLTIQKNGTTIDTFTANASSNKTINVVVPTKTSDITNDSNFVKNTDYASEGVIGVLKPAASYGTAVNGSGTLMGSTVSYSTYSQTNDTLLINKGTLENVITGKKLLTEDDIYYKHNDTYEADYIYTSGFLSNSTKGIYFTIFLPKRFKPNGSEDYNIVDATINTCDFYIRKSNGGYLENGTTKSTFSSIEYRDFSDNRLTFVCTKSSAYSSATNNTPIGVELRNVKITFKAPQPLV